MKRERQVLDIRKNNAVEEVRKLVRELDFVEVHTEILYQLMQSFVKLKKENRKLKEKLSKCASQRNYEDETWITLSGFLKKYPLIATRSKLRYAITNGCIRNFKSGKSFFIEEFEAQEYFNERKL